METHSIILARRIPWRGACRDNSPQGWKWVRHSLAIKQQQTQQAERTGKFQRFTSKSYTRWIFKFPSRSLWPWLKQVDSQKLTPQRGRLSIPKIKCSWTETDFPWTLCPTGKEIIVTCPLFVVICILMIEQSQTSWLDNEFGLDVSYQRDHCGCQISNITWKTDWSLTLLIHWAFLSKNYLCKYVTCEKIQCTQYYLIKTPWEPGYAEKENCCHLWGGCQSGFTQTGKWLPNKISLSYAEFLHL